MLRKIIVKAIYVCTVVCFSALLLVGCGSKSSNLETYKTNMNAFFDAVSDYNDAINEIDPNSETATKDLLSDLDGMNAEFQKMASYPIPDEFSSLGDLAKESASYMSQAVAAYHQAYDGAFNKDSADLAVQYYERANNRVHYMIMILHGEVPSGEGVTVTTKDTYNFTTIPDEDSQSSVAASSDTAQSDQPDDAASQE